jgi:hypothetical protein
MNDITTKREYKLIPHELMTIKGRSAVDKYIAHQPNSKEHGPIKAELTAVECICVNGERRWFGFERAYITSALRMAVSGWNPRFEEVQGWSDWSE